MASKISIRCLRVTQPIGDFFIGTIEAKELVAISFADIRRPDGRDIERYIGTQRDLSEVRVAEIAKYVGTVDACFPTSVILAISSERANFNKQTSTLVVDRDPEVAKIIDGQHRIAGLKNYVGPQFDVNVTIFIDMELEDQAMVFATINLKQTKVTKSLAYDLYEYAKARSPQKTSHNIAKLLNYREGSPMRNCIKILGKASGVETESITQATFVDRLMRLMTKDAMVDKDLLKRKKTLPRASHFDSQKLLFRNRFIDEEDAQIARIIWNYFLAVQLKWPKAWVSREKGHILGRTTGFAALLRVLPDVYQITGKPIDSSGSLPSVDDFFKVLQPISLRDATFTSDNFKPGSSGESALTVVLKAELKV